MASIQEPEVQFAQRLASNEKHIRTKAVKKLRKYITVRSQKETGGFTGDELLKLWKGLFYCLWMQDKPLLQEELSNQISTLIHSFHNIDGQFLYFESFLQTFKREWTGIDRLRMDKFFQLVRLMFRQTFELLKRTNWEKSVVARFLELLTAQLLQNGSGAPTGLQFHILDLYMTELAAVASAELTADQNLVFIEPFCKTAAKTKERTLFRAICNSIFSPIIDQAPFAIEDLMKEVKAAEASDSGQASEEDDEDRLKEKTKSKPVSKKERGKQINGNKSHTKRGDDGQSDDSDDELLHQEDSDTEVPWDDDIGPVLQFDYAALADRLFELASRSNTPSQNRQRLYKIIKVLRDLSEGIFPQDEYPEDVSTDEDDDMFGSRIRMKRGGGDIVQDEDGVPSAKKSRGKKNASILKKNKDLGTDNNELADCTVNNENQKKKRKKKKKKAQDASTGGEKNTKNSEEEQIVSSIQEAERGPQYLQAEFLEKETQMQSSISSVIVTEAATSDSQSEALLLSEVKKQSSVTVREENSQPTPSTTDNKDQSETLSKKKKKRKTSELKPEVTEEVGEHQAPVRTEPEMSTEALAPVSGKTKKKKGINVKIQTDGNVAESQVSEEAEITLESGEVIKNKQTLETDSTTPAKKKKKGMKAKKNDEAVEGASQINYASTEADIPSVLVMDTVEDGLTISFKQTTSSAPVKKRSKKNNVKANEVQGVEADAQLKAERKCIEAEITSVGEEASQDTITVPLRKKTKGKQYNTRLETLPAADKSTVTLLTIKRKKDQKESKTVEEAEVAAETPQVANAEKVLFDTTMKTPAKKQKKNQKLAAVELDEIKDPTQLQVVDDIVAELPLNETKVLSSSGKPAKKKKISVVFEFEADELEAAAQEAASINGLAEEETVAKKTKRGNDVGDPLTPLRTQKSQKKAKNSSASDFITFQSNAAVPTPIFCKTKGSPGTVLSSKKVKKSQTPKSESKKVTFGLKNNKTAEFRKTDRSLLVSPAGSSRVAFDPKQKPKFGVLKSPPTPRSASLTTTPSSYRKTSLSTPKSTPKQRPSAADFF